MVGEQQVAPFLGKRSEISRAERRLGETRLRKTGSVISRRPMGPGW